MKIKFFRVFLEDDFEQEVNVWLDTVMDPTLIDIIPLENEDSYDLFFRYIDL